MPKRVSVIGNFNIWDGSLFPMRSMGVSGVWELFIPDRMAPAKLYKFEIKTPDRSSTDQNRSVCLLYGIRPGTACITWDVDGYEWSDRQLGWRIRKPKIFSNPMNIYEVHLGSWLRIAEEENRWALTAKSPFP